MTREHNTPDAGASPPQSLVLSPQSSFPTQRVILMVWDGMRPDLVSAERTPNLYAFAQRSATYRRATGVFPSVTRPTTSSVSTGTYPAGHGIIANLFVGPPGDRAPIDTGLREELERLRAVNDGRILRLPTLAEALAGAGKRLVAMGSGTTGQLTLLDPERTATTIHTAFTWPEPLMASLSERFGPPPAKVIPVLAAHEWLTDVLLGYVIPEIEPDVVLMWLCEPDASQHARGLGSPEALAAMRGNDVCLGRILGALETSGVPTTVIVASDHGHSTVTGMVRADHALQSAGFGAALADGAIHLADSMIVIEPGPSAAFLRDDIGAWLHDQPWVGTFVNWSSALTGDSLITPAILWNGRDPSALPYAPTFTYSNAWTDATNEHGVAGSSLAGYSASLADLGRLQGPIVGLNQLTSTHGTLSPRDQRTVLFIGENGVRPGALDLPAGIVDIAPTILALLGLPPLPDADGRALTEAFTDGPLPASVAVRTEEPIAVPSGTVRRHWVGKTAYLETGTMRS
ncbi:MAG: alkaline phosphatase family protein [Thermomicrobiales bacterium]